MLKNITGALLVLLLVACHSVTPQGYDVIIRNGLLFDGSGEPGQRTDIAISGDKITRIGDLGKATAVIDLDASNQVVAPGFVNMLSWAPVTLIHDGRGLSDIKQGVTL